MDKIKNKIKILELCHFTSGICGVWARVREESKLLAADGYEVRVFSSKAVKGSDAIAEDLDYIDGVKIQRFPFKKLGGESFMKWDYTAAAMKYKPDIIIAHVYRHLHTTRALKIAKRLKCKVFLVTHAPFVDKDSTRSVPAKMAVALYDFFYGGRINKFDKIIAITKWEIPYLLALGARKSKITYIPNGIPTEFFKQKKLSEQHKILFLGRIAPIKDLETLVRAMKLIKDKKVILELVGPTEKEYTQKLKNLIKNLDLNDRIKFSPAIFDVKDKIKKIDSAKIFVLPSKREGMPQSLIEAMAREKIVIASDNYGARDLVINGKNGYLFRIGNSRELASKIDKALEENQTKLRKEAASNVRKFEWGKVTQMIEKLF